MELIVYKWDNDDSKFKVLFSNDKIMDIHITKDQIQMFVEEE
jgi:hypothetical protein